MLFQVSAAESKLNSLRRRLNGKTYLFSIFLFFSHFLHAAEIIDLKEELEEQKEEVKRVTSENEGLRDSIDNCMQELENQVSQNISFYFAFY